MSAAEGSVNWLPEELIVEVFLRLPKKSLLRSRCVSKGLRDLFDSPIFKKHCDIFHYTVSDFAVMTFDEDDGMFSMEFHLPDSLLSSVEKEVSIPHLKEPTFVACCKGIVCLLVSDLESYILLNPFSGTFQNVERSNLPRVDPRSAIGFGYDYATDDYKIVVLEPVGPDNVHYLNVYSMRRDSWGQVVGEFSPACSSPYLDGICVEGAIHWFSRNRTFGKLIPKPFLLAQLRLLSRFWL